MKNELLELAACAIQTAKSAGTNHCRATIVNDRSVEISYRERKPENIKEASKKNLSLDFYVDGRYSSQSTSDLRRDTLKEFIAKAVASTKLLAEDSFRTLPDPKYYQGRSDLDLQLADPSYPDFSPEERHTLVKTVEDSCLAKGGKKVISVTASENDSHVEMAALTSNGFEGYKEATYFGLGAMMTAQDEGDRRPMGYHFASSVKKKGLPPPDQIGAEAAQRTLDLLGGKKIKTETLPVIVENQNVSRLLSGFLSAMYGSNIQQKRSFLTDKKSQKVGSERFTLIDDPLVVEGFGSQWFDGDGLASGKRIMIEAGVLREFYVDWYYSRKLGWEPTTGGPSNLILPPGKRSVKAIMKDLGRGIFITGFIGGNSNSTTGDTSIGIIGRLFENGEPTQAVAEMNIADNHLKLWNKLAEAADDPWLYSSLRMPSLVFTDVVVSGA